MKGPRCCSPENQLSFLQRWQEDEGLEEALTPRKWIELHLKQINWLKTDEKEVVNSLLVPADKGISYIFYSKEN